MPEQSWPLSLSHVINEKIRLLKIHRLESQHNSFCKTSNNNQDIINVKTSSQGFGEITTRGNFIVLKLRGTQFEMGYQHGLLLAKEIHEPIPNQRIKDSTKPGSNPKDKDIKLYPADNQISFWANYIDRCIFQPMVPGLIAKNLIEGDLIPVFQSGVLADRIPNDVFRALCGVCAGYRKGLEIRIKKGMPLSGDMLTREDFIKSYIQPDLVNILIRWALGKGPRSIFASVLTSFFHLLPIPLAWPDSPVGSLGCTSVGFLPGKSVEGSLLFGNNFDYTPLAGLWEKNLVVVFCDPQPENDQGFYDKTNPMQQILQKYLFITSPGMHAALAGVNESGVTFRVHNNFSSDTDDARQIPEAGEDYDPFNKAHGQPLINFCDTLLRMTRNLASDQDEFNRLKNSIRNRISCIGNNKLTTNSPASGWTFLLAQPKKVGNNDASRIVVYETTANDKGLAEIPVKYEDAPQERFLLLKDLKEIKYGGNVQAIWQTNFFTSENLRKHDIFRTRFAQLNNINRFLRVGLEVRKKYEEGKVSWKDVANILADDRDVFSGDEGGDGVRRLSINTIAGISNIISVIYSIKPRGEGNKPDITFYLALPPNQKTPAAWGRYFKFNFDDLDHAGSGAQICSDTRWTPDGHDLNDEYSKAMVLLYEAYCHFAFNKKAERRIQFLIDKIQKSASILGKSPSKQCKEPFLDHLLGRLFILDSKMKKALDAFEACRSNNELVYDPHLITLTDYFIAKVCRVLFARTHYKIYEDRAKQAIQDLNKDLFFDKMKLRPEILEAIKPYLKHPLPAELDGLKLKYVRDDRLMNAILKLKDNVECGPENIEDEVCFEGVDLVKYKT